MNILNFNEYTKDIEHLNPYGENLNKSFKKILLGKQKYYILGHLIMKI